MRTEQVVRGGFTLIELLVVITIIGILMSLLLPAVNRIRETARRTECSNNMRQVALAILNYETTMKVFPPSHMTTPQRHTFVPFILPHLEQQAVRDLYRMDRNFDHQDNQPAVRTVLQVLLCPSTPEDFNRLANYGSDRRGAVKDYAVPTGYENQLVQQGLADNVSDRRAIMIPNEATRQARIRDGMGYSMLFTEDAGRPVHYIKGAIRGPNDHNNGCGNFNVSGGVVPGAGWSDANSSIPMHGFTQDGMQCPGPCAVNCTNNNEAYGFHPGGINTAFGDGGIRFINETVTVRVFAQLITCNGGEVIESDQLNW